MCKIRHNEVCDRFVRRSEMCGAVWQKRPAKLSHSRCHTSALTSRRSDSFHRYTFGFTLALRLTRWVDILTGQVSLATSSRGDVPVSPPACSPAAPS